MVFIANLHDPERLGNTVSPLHRNLNVRVPAENWRAAHHTWENVLQAALGNVSLERWADRVVSANDMHQADKVLLDRNFGSDLGLTVLRRACPNLRSRW
jgi:hypothetical protein